MSSEDGRAATDKRNSQLRLRFKSNSSNDAFLCVNSSLLEQGDSSHIMHYNISYVTVVLVTLFPDKIFKIFRCIKQYIICISILRFIPHTLQ
jgi:hypothetical protein